ncbi:unnamed protein product [Vitrella brassicaformis CCMP3155]|uniref:Uncharacterized protein n=2 Tax=Vitrella brassicaformis TaxID=1169539 RepID=A0A0G4FKM1_VITBC|nr:unnamed protein product [Vitrella brassicaformis CCMP3155]|eukprot:CEM14543.1 unnamed protein product [Vitrella brassicaformis CCMP3155]
MALLLLLIIATTCADARSKKERWHYSSRHKGILTAPSKADDPLMDATLVEQQMKSRGLYEQQIRPDPTTGVPHVVWTFWFGKPMVGKRLESFRMIQENIGVPVMLVTETNLPLCNLSHFPIHSAFPYLSGLHKSDYLRSYFMHFFGGGYHDIKPETHSWADKFNELHDSNVWLYGVAETKGGVACDEGFCVKELCTTTPASWCSQNNCCRTLTNDEYAKLVVNCEWIMRPRTEMTRIWIEAVKNDLDQQIDNLKAHPAPFPRCCQHGENNYPLAWAQLQGQKFHPLQYKFLKHIKQGLLPWEKGGEYFGENEYVAENVSRSM